MVRKPAFEDLDTLAAAQANRGDFDAAKRTLTQAMKVASNAQRHVLAERLKLYQQSEPYRLPGGANSEKLADGPVSGPRFR